MAMTLPVDETSAGVSGLRTAALLLHAFGEPSRLAILHHLRLGEHRVVDLTEHLGLAQSTVSKHLACLRECGLVDSRPVGRASMFSLNHTAEVLDLLAATERLLAATGEAVVLCATSGVDGTETAEHAALGVS